MTVKQQVQAMCFTVMIPVEHPLPDIDAFEAGLVLGLLIGEGSFGGDGRQPQAVLRLNVRHEPLFRWLKARFPYARLYGPYNHDGRRYFQFMWRGVHLKYGLMPFLEALPWSTIDAHSWGRYRAMKERYGLDDVPVHTVPALAGREIRYAAEATAALLAAPSSRADVSPEFRSGAETADPSAPPS